MTMPMPVPMPPKRLTCGNVLEVNLAADVLPANIAGLVMQLAICWPDFEFETVTHLGQNVTVNGELIYALVQD